MPAGLNLFCDFIRLIYTDDDVGGAYPTGTILQSNISGRIEEDQVTTEFLQQGLETVNIFSGIFWGNNLLLREQDEIQVVSPPNHEYFGKRFRVLHRGTNSNHPSNKQNYITVKLTRSQLAHAESFQ